MSLNEKQKAFCEHYAATLNATEAAKRAGYSEKTAYSQGQRLLKNVEIKTYLEQLTKNAQNSRIATIEEVYEYLTETMRDERIMRKDRTKAAQILQEALERGKESSGSGSGEVKIVIERKVVDLSKDKK